MENKKFELIKGVAEKVRHTATVHGSSHNGNGTVQTMHISLLLVDKNQVKIETPTPILIENDDSVAVTGKKKNGVFCALAYKNIDTGAIGRVRIDLLLMIGIPMVIMGLMLLETRYESLYNIRHFLKALSFPCIGIGVFLLLKVKTILEAVDVVRSEH